MYWTKGLRGLNKVPLSYVLDKGTERVKQSPFVLCIGQRDCEV